MIVIGIELIDDSYTERKRIAKRAIVYSFYIKMIDKTKIAFCLQYRINFYESFAQVIPIPFIVNGFFPVRVISIFIFHRDRPCKIQQIFMQNRKRNFTAMMLQVGM